MTSDQGFSSGTPPVWPPPPPGGGAPAANEPDVPVDGALAGVPPLPPPIPGPAPAPPIQPAPPVPSSGPVWATPPAAFGGQAPPVGPPQAPPVGPPQVAEEPRVAEAPAPRYPPTAPVFPPAPVAAPPPPVSAPPAGFPPPFQGTPAPQPAPQPVAAPVMAPADYPSFTTVLLPLAIGAAVIVALGVYGKVHDPTGIGVNLAGFSGPLEAKVWLATGAFGLAIVQLLSALVMYGKVPGVRAPSWTGTVHRWSGRIAFLCAVPVAVHCLYAVGFQSFDTRTLVHSVVGCLFFGAFTVKMLVLPKRGVPGWVLPLFGGLVFTGLVVLWLTSSFWFFTTVGVKF